MLVELESYFTYEGIKHFIKQQGLDVIETENIFTKGEKELTIPKYTRLQVASNRWIRTQEAMTINEKQILVWQNGDNIFAITDEKFREFLRKGRTVNEG